jgi:hypothetical protein
LLRLVKPLQINKQKHARPHHMTRSLHKPPPINTTKVQALVGGITPHKTTRKCSRS